MSTVTRLLCLAGVATCCAAFTADASAGAFLDWLFHRRTAANCSPTTALYPTVAAVNPGTQVCQRVTVSYAPYTTYRTAWAQVPVTYFRPVAGTDPATGCPVTSMQPCTTYTWQVQRVPVVGYRPVYQTAAVVPTVTTVAQPVVTAPATPSCACAGQAAPSAVQVMPGAGTAIPQNTIPYGTTPGITVPPGYSIPGTTPGAVAPGTGGAADTQPTLGAGASQSYPQGAGTYPAFVSPSERSVLSYPPASAPPASTATGAAGTPIYGNSTPSPPQAAAPTPAEAALQSSNTPARLHDVKPIPDPDAPQVAPRQFDAPQLLNPKDKTAHRPIQHAWAFTTITWNKPPRVAAAASYVEPVAPSRDDQGWRSARSSR